MSSSGRSRRSQIDSSVASSDGFGDDNLSIDVERDEVKRKSRNLSEKKRRDQFNMLINELCSMVNLDPSEDIGSSGNKKMDKSSVLRATITFLKNHTEETKHHANEIGEDNCQPDNSASSGFINSWKPSFLSTEEFSHLSLEALDAFILVFEADSEGKIIYASESIFPLLGISSSYLSNKSSTSSSAPGLSSVASNSSLMTINIDNDANHGGISVYDIIHEKEKSALRKLVIEAVSSGKTDEFVSMMIHFRHDSSNLNQTETFSEYFYELVRLVGTFRKIDDYMGYGVPKNCFMTICRLQTPKLLKELRILAPLSNDYGAIKNNEFISRHSLEWKFLFLDHRAPMIIGYLPFEVLGTSGYDYYHWDDLDLVVAGHQRLMQIGSGESCYYRFLTKGQQWIWLRTKYFITYHMWNSKPEFVVCTHTVIDFDERLGNNLKDDSRQNDSGKVNQDTNSSRNITSSDLIKSKTPQWSINEFNEGINDQSIYISEKTGVTYPVPNDSNGSTTYSMNSNMMAVAIEGSLSLASSSNSSADYILNNSMYEPSPYLINQTSTTQPQQQHQATITHNMVEQPKQSTSHIVQQNPQPQTHHLSHHQPKQCQQQQQHQPSTISPVSYHQQVSQDFGNTSVIPQTDPMVPNSIVSVAQYANMSTGNSQVSYANLQESLQKKHQILQKQIKEQQEELRRVSEQLMLVQVVNPPLNSQEATIKSSSDLTLLQSVTQTHNIQSLQPSLTNETLNRVDNDLSSVGAIYTDLSCPDHTMISREFSTSLQNVDLLYPQEKSSI
ncbi:circadian locomoter output cycles protein kaput isoform X2 [Tetranychus urticae]|uniref:circadian locomoter output cycles protein kaput isoform X2 n=1 Tax=Tetranychus urticae TaxID=32264 RepID=UPI00077C0200|nr:circadian locomoter output cycles protein kaput isoform X2 [Tetranychus urticae]